AAGWRGDLAAQSAAGTDRDRVAAPGRAEDRRRGQGAGTARGRCVSNIEGHAKMEADVGVVRAKPDLDVVLQPPLRPAESLIKAQGLLIELRSKVTAQPMLQFSDIGLTLVTAIDFLLDRYIHEAT